MGFAANDPLNPVACGGLGHSEIGYHNDTCYKLNWASGQWTETAVAILAQPRIYTGALKTKTVKEKLIQIKDWLNFSGSHYHTDPLFMGK